LRSQQTCPTAPQLAQVPPAVPDVSQVVSGAEQKGAPPPVPAQHPSPGAPQPPHDRLAPQVPLPHAAPDPTQVPALQQPLAQVSPPQHGSPVAPQVAQVSLLHPRPAPRQA
jgi:hypothetical protein